MKIGEGDGKVVESREAWEKFVSAVAEMGGLNDNRKSIQGTSLNLEERRWVGVLGWESSEVSLKYLLVCWWVKSNWLTLRLQIREKVLGSAAVKEAKRSLDVLVWNTFVTAFAKQ